MPDTTPTNDYLLQKAEWFGEIRTFIKEAFRSIEKRATIESVDAVKEWLIRVEERVEKNQTNINGLDKLQAHDDYDTVRQEIKDLKETVVDIRIEAAREGGKRGAIYSFIVTLILLVIKEIFFK